MGVQVRERTIEEIEEKLSTIRTELNKITYLESALREAGFSFEIKRFLYGELSRLYEEKKMYDKAARAMANKAGMEVTFREKIDSYVSAAELYARMGRVDDADEMFVRAMRDSNVEQKAKIKLARKNVYLVSALSLEKAGKRGGSVKFYEKLVRMGLEESEKNQIKKKLVVMYKALGMFREAKLLEGV